MLSSEEQASLTAAYATVPLTNNTYIATNFVLTLLETVIDYQQHTTTVRRAIAHFNENQWQAVRTLGDLKVLLNRFPDDREGNTALARHLWNYKFWRRASELRGLVALFDRLGIDTLEALRDWAACSNFRDDFQGRVKGLGPVVYQWLVMRLGVETVKPDVHIVRFVSRTVGRPVSDDEVVVGIVAAAKALALRANHLDWSIWERQNQRA